MIDLLELLRGEVFDKAYEYYQDECKGISFHVCDSYYAPGELEERYKEAARWMVKRVLEEYAKLQELDMSDLLSAPR